MQTVEAIYQGGVFKPLQDVQLDENERVVLTLKTSRNEEALAWFKRMAEAQDRFVAEHGFLPDSTPDIAEDRMRDV
jgi:predicted DNA-binding antitoxin AbrB/MazE fold protein